MADFLDEILSSQPTVTDEEEDEQAHSDEDEVVGAEVPRSARALELLSDAGISLSELLDDVLLGDPLARGNRKVMTARSEIYSSGVLPRVLDRIRRPSDMQIRGAKHEAAIVDIENWANDTTVDVLRYELAKHAKSAKAANVETDVVSDEALKELTFDAVSEEVQSNAPRLFDTLSKICTLPRHAENTQKDSKFSVTLLVNALAYQLSHKSNRMQKLICIYLKAKGVPKSCFNFFQKAGLSLGYEWSRTALEKISAAAMAEAIAAFEDHPCIAMHDNIRLPFPVKHQRDSKKTVTDNGTAMTIISLRDRQRAIEVLWNSQVLHEHWSRITHLYRSGQARLYQLNVSHLFEHPGFQSWGKRIDNHALAAF